MVKILLQKRFSDEKNKKITMANLYHLCYSYRYQNNSIREV